MTTLIALLLCAQVKSDWRAPRPNTVQSRFLTRGPGGYSPQAAKAARPPKTGREKMAADNAAKAKAKAAGVKPVATKPAVRRATRSEVLAALKEMTADERAALMAEAGK